MLTGDARTACEVVLCLSSAQGKGISECKSFPCVNILVLEQKNGIKHLAKRRAFLDLCPAANENAKMSALTTQFNIKNTLATLKRLTVVQKPVLIGFCRSKDDGGSYVRRLVRTQSYMPKFCEDLYNHEFTEYSQIKKPKYTCDANKWYSRSDWNRGYERIVVSRKWNRYNEEYDVVYKDVPIKRLLAIIE